MTLNLSKLYKKAIRFTWNTIKFLFYLFSFISRLDYFFVQIKSVSRGTFFIFIRFNISDETVFNCLDSLDCFTWNEILKFHNSFFKRINIKENVFRRV